MREADPAGATRTRRTAIIFPSILLLLTTFAAGTAHATIDHTPVKVRLLGAPPFAIAGEVFTATFEITAARGVEVRDLGISANGWQRGRLGGGANFSMYGGQKLELAYTAVPGANFAPLVMTATLDGRPWRRSFDLSREAHGGWLPADSPLLPPRRVLPATSAEHPGAAAPTLALLEAMGTEEPASPDGTRSMMRVTGHLSYFHEDDDVFCPAFGAKTRVYYSFDGITWFHTDNLYTGADGSFACDIPAGFTLGAVWFQASNRAAVLETPGSESDYEWSSGTFDLPTGVTQADIGTFWPNSYKAALHLMSDLTWQHDYFISLGWDMTSIDVQWPDEDAPTGSYSPTFEEIHIPRAMSWADYDVCHEWGHFWHHHFCHHPSVDYCNGICDDDGCGHCGWCPEFSEVAWNEGCADFISRIATDHIERQQLPFGVWEDPIGTLDMRYIGPDCPWDPWHTEGVVAAAAYDMADGDAGTEMDMAHYDALGNRVHDELALGDAHVLNIMSQDCAVEGDQPHRFPGFFRCAIEYLNELGLPGATPVELWETAWNCDLQLDSLPPPQAGSLWCSVPVGVPTQTSRLSFTWAPSVDDLSGTVGYSITLVEGYGDYPDTTIDVRGTAYNSDQLAPGSWYFALRPVDRAGHWQGAVTVSGPYLVIAPDPADLISETPAGWTAPLVVRSTTVPLPDPVTQTPTINGSVVYLNWGETNQGGGPTGNFRDQVLLDGVPIDTSTVHYLGAGRSTSFRNQGPFELGLTGRHTIWLSCDQPDSVPETDEMNNIFAKQFVFAPPDLLPGAMLQSGLLLPDMFAGQHLLPGGTTFHPNCVGYDCDISILPEVVWLVPASSSQLDVLRLHPRVVGQGGFAEPLVESWSSAALPAAVLQVPTVSGLGSFMVGVSAPVEGQAGFRLSREECRYLALPDSVNDSLPAFDCLDGYGLLNSEGADRWFTVRLENLDMEPLTLRLFAPGFAMGTLADADTVLTAGPRRTVIHNLYLPDDALALAVVGRDPRIPATSRFRLQFHLEKPDVEAHRPDTWFANLVPQVGTPYDPVTDAIPAPAALGGGTATTSIYHSFRVASQDAGVPIGLQHRVDLDGESLFSQAFIAPLDPGQELRLLRAPSTLYAVRGGRHALTHLLNSSGYIDEDDYDNNRYGRQWCWSPRAIAPDSSYALPAPPDPFGGLSMVTEGRIAPNCDGYVVNETPSTVSIFAAYSWDETLDIDLALHTSAHVDTGFTTVFTESQASGIAADFVLEYMPLHRAYHHYVGVTRGSGAASGTFTLRATRSSDVWSHPVGSSLTGTIEAGTFLDVARTSLSTGIYRLELTSGDAPLGFSLHDLSDGFGARTEPFADGIAVQAGAEQVSFIVVVPEGTPSTLALAVWRRDGSSSAVAARWRVAVSGDLTGVAATGGEGAAPLLSRLVAATPNPFAGRTEIAFETARDGSVALEIYDIGGRLVRTLVADVAAVGRRTAAWDGTDAGGRRVSGGVYLARLRAPEGRTDWMKLVLIR